MCPVKLCEQMGISCYLNSPAPLSGDELSTLHRAIDPLAEGLEWGCESFTLAAAVQVDGLFVATKIHNEDGDVLWRDLMQCLALSVVASRALPGRLFTFEDDLDLLGVEVGRVSLRGGRAQDEGVDARMRRAICGAVDGPLFGIDDGGEAKDLTREREPKEAPSVTATLRWPPEDVSPHSWTNRPSVQGYVFQQHPADDDGDLHIEGEFELLNADDQAAAELGIVVRLLDEQGDLISVVEEHDGPVAPGARCVLQSSSWVKDGLVARAEVWVTRTERTVHRVDPEVFWRGPDGEGDHRADLHLRWHNTHPVQCAVLEVLWEGGEQDELVLQGVGAGDQLLQFSCYDFASDEERKAGQGCTATLTLDSVRWWEGAPPAEAPQLPVPVETVEPEPVADGPVAEPEALPEDAGPWKRVLAGDIDGALLRLVDLDSEGRDITRRLLDSDQADDVVAGLRIARHCNWRSAATVARRLFDHPDARVREQACLACGEMGGPSLVIPLRGLLRDPDPRVRRAADNAIARIEG